jgi:D-methionine transport system substrate-binding protein
MGVYPGNKKSFDELEDGDVIVVPNDVTNEARALLLLETNGVIKLKEGAGVTATINDIVEYPKAKVEFKEVEAAIIPGEGLKDAALGVINANYAIGAGLKASDAIAIEEEDSLAADTYVNVLVVNAENKDSEKTKALIAALQTDDVKQFITDTYEGAVLPKF